MNADGVAPIHALYPHPSAALECIHEIRALQLRERTCTEEPAVKPHARHVAIALIIAVIFIVIATVAAHILR